MRPAPISVLSISNHGLRNSWTEIMIWGAEAIIPSSLLYNLRGHSWHHATVTVIVCGCWQYLWYDSGLIHYPIHYQCSVEIANLAPTRLDSWQTPGTAELSKWNTFSKKSTSHGLHNQTCCYQCACAKGLSDQFFLSVCLSVRWKILKSECRQG